jgi:hypothetical protein
MAREQHAHQSIIGSQRREMNSYPKLSTSLASSSKSYASKNIGPPYSMYEIA